MLNCRISHGFNCVFSLCSLSVQAVLFELHSSFKNANSPLFVCCSSAALPLKSSPRFHRVNLLFLGVPSEFKCKFFLVRPCFVCCSCQNSGRCHGKVQSSGSSAGASIFIVPCRILKKTHFPSIVRNFCSTLQVFSLLCLPFPTT